MSLLLLSPLNAVEICVFQSLGWISDTFPPVFNNELYQEDISDLPPTVRLTSYHQTTER